MPHDRMPPEPRTSHNVPWLRICRPRFPGRDPGKLKSLTVLLRPRGGTFTPKSEVEKGHAESFLPPVVLTTMADQALITLCLTPSISS